MTKARKIEIRALAEKHVGKQASAALLIECLDEIDALCKAKATRNPLLKLEMPLALHKIEGFEVAWQDFVADRRERRKPLTSRAAKMILNRLSEQPGRAVEALRKAIEKGWTSFEWDWLDRNGASKVSPGAGNQSIGKRYAIG